MRVVKLDKDIDSEVLYSGEPSNLFFKQEYLVYGIEVVGNEKHYLIHIPGDYTVRLYDYRNFEIIDNSKSKYWIEDNTCKGRYLFEDWISFDDYLEWFFNGVEFLEIDIFSCPVERFPYYQELIEGEEASREE